jgi:hypothetical protein
MGTTLNKPETAEVGQRTTFAVTTDLPFPYKFHWRRNGILIPASPSASTYTTLPLAAGDFGAKFSCTVYSVVGQETTPEVTLEKETAHAVVNLEPGRLPKKDG